MAPKVRERHFRDVDVVDQNAPACRRVIPRDQVDQRTLPRTAWPDQGNSFPSIALIRETHIAEFHPAFGHMESSPVGTILFTFLIDDLENIPSRHQRFLYSRNAFAERL